MEVPSNLEEKQARVALRSVPGLGSQRLRQLVAVFGSAAAAWRAPASALARCGEAAWVQELIKHRSLTDPAAVWQELRRQEISAVMPGEAPYPFLLAELADAPPVLYYRGQLLTQAEAIAIVGSRRATPYGTAAAGALAKELAAHRLVVVSGLARGIDTAAHEGALAAQSITWAFLGCGVDQVYPPENRKLAERILERGAILSEFAPGTPPQATHFPARNRLISGCARGVVVVEAGTKSGALITADFALEQGREVFAVPGPIFSEASRGTHWLLRQGATLVERAADILAELPAAAGGATSHRSQPDSEDKGERVEASCRMESGKAAKAAAHKTRGGAPQDLAGGRTDWTAEQAVVLEQLSDVPRHIDQIAMQCALPAAALALALLELELRGRVIHLPGQHYVLARQEPEAAPSPNRSTGQGSENRLR